MPEPAMPRIWVTDLMDQVSQLMRPEMPVEMTASEAIKCVWDRQRYFEVIDPTLLPTFFFATETSSAFQKHPPDAFKASFPLVSRRCRTLLERHDLGDTCFHSVELRRNDKTTPLERPDYSILNVAETKPGSVDREASDIRLINKETGVWRKTWGKPFGGFTIHRSAAQGVDLWGERGIVDALFVSDRLVTAIRAQGIRGLDLIPCNVID